VIGTHTLKFGGQFHYDQVNEESQRHVQRNVQYRRHRNRLAFADFLLGFPSNFTQTTGQRFYLRNRYGAAFAEDSWRARSNLTLNFGVSAGI
jgi:outer membrane receptor for ferrienterochelin and colicin